MRPLTKALAIVSAAMIIIAVAAVWQFDRFLGSTVSVPEEGIEPALAKDWNRPEEDAAWSHLQPER